LPLFVQLGRDEPPSDAITDTLLRAQPRPGLLAIEVRSRSKRAGYAEVRGDGGYIDSFTKALTTIGRALVLRTEGIEPMAAKDATVVVTGLELTEGTEGGGASIAWAWAGSVMRAEAWAELSAIVR
jgi:hypothetical protein